MSRSRSIAHVCAFATATLATAGTARADDSTECGYQLVTLTNKHGDNGDRNDVRIASPIYAFASMLPVAANHFAEAQLLVDPNLRGTLSVFDRLGRSHPNEPEQGADVDDSAFEPRFELGGR